MKDKQRADQCLVEQQLAPSRSLAAKLIKAGAVEVELAGSWQSVDKPSLQIPSDAKLRLLDNAETQYVSRGGHKLAHALKAADLTVSGLVALDVGQSTGGFTDCLLQRGVAKVVGVDVGCDQLSSALKADPRVVCFEGINGRDMAAEPLLAHAPGGFDLAVMDVSFISQTLILPNLPPLLKSGGWLFSLVKPQFEVGKDNIGKGGIVRDPALYSQVETKIRSCVEQLGFVWLDYLPSPITGGDGNREFLLIARLPE